MGIAMGSEGESAGVNAQDPAARKVVEYFLKKKEKSWKKVAVLELWKYWSLDAGRAPEIPCCRSSPSVFQREKKFTLSAQLRAVHLILL